MHKFKFLIVALGLQAWILESCIAEKPPQQGRTYAKGKTQAAASEGNKTDDEVILPNNGNGSQNENEPAKEMVPDVANTDPRWACLLGEKKMGIIGGQPVAADDPKVGAATIGIADDSGSPFCTGTLVGPNHVVSAAHCMFNPDTEQPLTAAEVTRLSIVMGPRGTRVPGVKVVKMVMHEGFNFTEGEDIAVLILEGELPSNVKPVRIGAYQANADIKSVIMAGYGKSSDDDQTAPLLRQVEVGVDRFYPNFGEFDLVVGTRKGTCNGDSGGPAFIQSTTFPGCLELIGATSRGARNAQSDECNSGNGINTDVRMYKQWAECVFMKNQKPLPYSNTAQLAKDCAMP